MFKRTPEGLVVTGNLSRRVSSVEKDNMFKRTLEELVVTGNLSRRVSYVEK